MRRSALCCAAKPAGRSTVANDNTIKACGGSNCHTPWTYAYDGEKFRLIDNGGAKPSAAAALPFADEKQRAANLYAGLSRNAAQPLATQNWRSARSGNDGMTVTARVGRRSELVYKCSSSDFGALAYEALELHDKPAPNTPGSADIEIEPTLAYGESGDNAPMLLDGRPCGPVDVPGEGGVVRLQTPDEPASACLEGLSRAKVATLPLLHQNGLLRVRLDGGGAGFVIRAQGMPGRPDRERDAGDTAACGYAHDAATRQHTRSARRPGARLCRGIHAAHGRPYGRGAGFRTQ